MNRIALAALSGIVMLTPIFANAVLAPADLQGNCLQQDSGYGLVGAGGKIDPVKLYTLGVAKFGASGVSGRTDASLTKFGVTTGDPREWARLFVMVCQQESGCRMAPKNSDGSLQKFSSTPSGEQSYGPLQFNIGEYGLQNWDMVNSPSCTMDAFIRVAQQGKLLTYFGSMKRPNETMQHAGWFNSQVAPYTDSSTLTYDPEAASRNYQSVTPYLANPYGTNTGAQNSGGGGTQPYYAMQPAGGSPYASASPVPVSGGTAASQQIPVSQQLNASPYSAVTTSQSAATNLQAALAQPVASQGQAVVPGAPSVGAIYAQPRRVSASGAFSLSWVSLNMKPGSCTVKQGATTLVSGNEGTRPVPATSLPTGTVTFTLSCTAQDGSGFSTTDTVAVY